MNSKIFNIETGDFNVDENFTISSTVSLSEIEKYFQNQFFSFEKYKDELSVIRIRNLKIGKLYFILILSFKGEILKSNEFLMNEILYEENPSWDNFSVDQAEEQMRFVEHWYYEHASAREEKRVWGTVGLYYDFHNLSKSIIVVYDN